MRHSKSTDSLSDVFLVDVKFRRNFTWQGTVLHRGNKQKIPFRSALELIRIMDAVVEEKQDNPETTKDEGAEDSKNNQ